MLRCICPVYPSKDFVRTRAFYKRLGFSLVELDETEGYLVMRRGEVKLHFFLFKNMRTTLSERKANLQIVDSRRSTNGFRRSKSHELVTLSELEKQDEDVDDEPWVNGEVAILDPDGNVLLVASDHRQVTT